MKRKLRILLDILSVGIVSVFCVDVLTSKHYLLPIRYYYYKLFGFIGLHFQNTFNQFMIPTVLWIIFTFFGFTMSIYLSVKFILPIIKKVLKLDLIVIDHDRSIRLFFSTIIGLFFLIYDGWLLNYFITLNWSIKSFKILFFLIIGNMILLLTSVGLWLLLVNGRWERLWFFLNKAFPFLKTTFLIIIRIFATSLVILVMVLNIIVFIDRQKKVPDYPNIFLISIDTFRADHVGCYGYEKSITPSIDAFSKDSVLFKNCIAQASYTTASHASMFTSLIPTHHKLLDGRQFNVGTTIDTISCNVLTIAEVLKNYYYTTISYNGGGTVSGEFGFDRGFDKYCTVIGKFDNTVEVFKRWINEHLKNNQKVFLFLHTFELHDSYAPASEYLKQLEEGYQGILPDEMSKKEHFDKINSGELKINKDDLQHIINLYDGEIMSMDTAFDSFIDFLKEKGLYDSSFIILTSDHGEEFNDHGKVGIHGHTLYDELIRVPLIIKFPYSKFRGGIVHSQVRSIDILPTILDLLAVQGYEYFEGESLLPMISADDSSYKEFAVSQIQEVGLEVLSSIRTDEWKLYKDALFNLKEDVKEQKNVASENPKIFNDLKVKLNQVEDKNGIPILETKEPSAALSEKLKEELRALNYLQ